MARNVGLDNSTGEFIFFMDADDILPKESLSKLISKQRERNADFVFGNSYVLINSILKKNTKYNSEELISYRKIVSDLTTGNLTSIWGKLYRHSLIKNIRFFVGLPTGEDIHYLTQIFLSYKEIRVLQIKSFVYTYRVNYNSVSHQKKSKEYKINSCIYHLKGLYWLLQNYKDKMEDNYASNYINTIGKYIILYTRLMPTRLKYRKDFEYIYNTLKHDFSTIVKKRLDYLYLANSVEYFIFILYLKTINSFERIYNQSVGKVINKLKTMRRIRPH